MKIAVIFLALVAAATAIPRPILSLRPGFGTKLVGAEEAREKEFPFSVILMVPFNDGWLPFCSGAIYDETRIITSGTCAIVYSTLADNDFTILAGLHDWNHQTGQEQQRVAIKHTVHENYDPKTYQNDIGIITVDSPFIFTDRIQPIRIAQPNQVPSGVDVITCGHGADETGSWGFFMPVLQKATLKSISRDECNKASERVDITESMVCAAALKTGLCNGDGGDPLIAKDEAGREYLAGVGIFAISSCGEYPSVFTAIGPFRQWLDSTLNE